MFIGVKLVEAKGGERRRCCCGVAVVGGTAPMRVGTGKRVSSP